MQAKDHVSFWLWNALLTFFLSLILAFYWGRPFLFAGAALVVYYGLRPFLVSRHLVKRLMMKRKF